uniref:Uhu n=1 Tax=Drosophila heteroneura TaxID=32382 RepID=V9H1D1_DROHE|nr:Uhu [Drosophila heteroneura]
MGKRTTIEQRNLILEHFKIGYSHRQIAKMVNLSTTTVFNIIRRFVDENRIEDKGRKAPNKIFTEQEDRRSIRKIRENPKLSAPKLTQQVQDEMGKKCSVQTVRRVLHNHDFNARVPRKKPFISTKNKGTRMTFAKTHLDKDLEFWNTIIFEDESKFIIFGSDGRNYVWRQSNTELNPKHLKATVKHGGGSVMVWACISAAGVGNLVFIEPTMDKNVYLNILKENLLQSAEKLGIRRTFRFYQDNDQDNNQA